MRKPPNGACSTNFTVHAARLLKLDLGPFDGHFLAYVSSKGRKLEEEAQDLP
jgi:hypothetical protein